jgi:predicted CoA-substrate-specific enzyme activase
VIIAGVDVGSLSTKAVIMKNNKILSWALLPTGTDGTEAARRVINSALKDKGLSIGELEYTVATGYGRFNVPFAQSNVTEISCHARGANWLCPQVHTILDMGGQDCKAIRCDEKGRVLDFALNEKCAAGTGRYLERVAATLEIPLDRIGPLSLQTVEGPVSIRNSCAVFAQNDILVSLREGKHPNDILAGAHEAISSRIQDLLAKVGVAEVLTISGGIAKNVGVVKRLEEKLGVKAFLPPEPQIVGALGAAIFAGEKWRTEMKPQNIKPETENQTR